MFTGMVFVFEGTSLGKGQILPSSESHRNQEPHIYCVRVNARDSKFLELRGFWRVLFSSLYKGTFGPNRTPQGRGTNFLPIYSKQDSLASTATPEVVKRLAAMLKTDSRNWNFQKCSFFAIPGSSPWLPSHSKWQSYTEGVLFQSTAAWNLILAATGVLFLFGSCHS